MEIQATGATAPCDQLQLSQFVLKGFPPLSFLDLDRASLVRRVLAACSDVALSFLLDLFPAVPKRSLLNPF